MMKIKIIRKKKKQNEDIQDNDYKSYSKNIIDHENEEIHVNEDNK